MLILLTCLLCLSYNLWMTLVAHFVTKDLYIFMDTKGFGVNRLVPLLPEALFNSSLRQMRRSRFPFPPANLVFLSEQIMAEL